MLDEVAGEALDVLLLVADLAGTFVFALSGAVLAVRRDLDVFGIAVLAGAAAFGGGMLRDVLIGAGPPTALVDARYPAVALLAAALVALWSSAFERLGATVSVLDAGGLALFAVTGTRIALAAELPRVAAIVLGVVTAVGGGIARDVLAREVPLVLRHEIYALAALLGAVLVVVGAGLGLPEAPTAIVAALAVFTLRMLAIRFGWQPPGARGARRHA